MGVNDEHEKFMVLLDHVANMLEQINGKLDRVLADSRSLSDWVAEVEARDGKPALGDPDDVLTAHGFPEPLRDERIHPTFAGILSGHLHAGRGQS